MRHRLVIAIVLTALLVVTCATVTEATAVFPFTGHGTSGAAAPAPLQWVVFVDFNQLIPIWTIGLTSWPSTTSVTDFHITFSGSLSAFISGGEFIQIGANNWTTQISSGAGTKTLDFFAPAGVSLDFGEQFAVDVLFVNAAITPPTVDFTANWTTASVPEPSLLTLFGAGLLLLPAIRRRRPHA